MSNLTSLSSHKVSDISGVLLGVVENSLPWRDECALETDIRAINICLPPFPCLQYNHRDATIPAHTVTDHLLYTL